MFFPTTGQFVRAVGMSFDDLENYLEPAGAPLASRLIPEDTAGLNARISVRGENIADVVPEDVADLLTHLRELSGLPNSGRTCFGSRPGTRSTGST